MAVAADRRRSLLVAALGSRTADMQLAWFGTFFRPSANRQALSGSGLIVPDRRRALLTAALGFLQLPPQTSAP
jgi:hypothetical protein